MKLTKQNQLVIFLNLFVCILTVVVAKFILVPGYANKEEVKQVPYDEEFDISKQEFAFDVSDFAYKDLSYVDIVNMGFSSGISVVGSDFKISDDTLARLRNVIDNYGASTSFLIVSLNDGFAVGYNVDRQFETASSIKAPYAFYVYREIANGNVDPNGEITYTSNYYNKGTGVVKFYDYGTKFTVKQLLYFSLNDSDNIAHMLLHGTYGARGYNAMLRELGTKQLYLTEGNPWGFTSARSAAIVWQAMYNFSIQSSEGIELMNILSNGKYNYYKEVMPDLPSASKTGFAMKDVVETGIVFDEKPYIAIAMANKGGNYSAYSEVLKLISCMNDIMNEYDEYTKKES